MNFKPERLISVREHLGISKAEAARRLNMSAMGYGRYERGEREPSYQTVCYIAQQFGTSAEYLYGESDKAHTDYITITAEHNPALFELVQQCLNDEDNTARRILAYLESLNSLRGDHEDKQD